MQLYKLCLLLTQLTNNNAVTNIATFALHIEGTIATYFAVLAPARGLKPAPAPALLAQMYCSAGVLYYGNSTNVCRQKRTLHNTKTRLPPLFCP